MSDFWQQAIPVLFMFGICLALAPFIGFAMWLGLSGDKARELAAAERVAVRVAVPVEAVRDVAQPRDEAAAPHRAITAAAGAA